MVAFQEQTGCYTCTLNPGGQTSFAHDFTSYMVALQGGWGSGKTYIGARKFCYIHYLNAFKFTFCDGDWYRGEKLFVPSVVVAPTYSNAMDFDCPNIYDALDDQGLEYKFHSFGPIAGGRFSGPAIEVFDYGTKERPSLMLIRTADSPKRITGFEVGQAWGDEPARWKENRFEPLNDAFIQLLGRVRHPKANIIQMNFTYTNEGDETRIYEEMHNGNPDRSLHTASTRENPIMDKFVERQMANLTPELAEQYIEGGAANFRGGKVYSRFSIENNVDGGLKYIPELPLHISFDFNSEPGMHAELGQYHKSQDCLVVTCNSNGPN